MPDLTKCPFCGAPRNADFTDPLTPTFACGTCEIADGLLRSPHCKLNVAQARLEALEALAVEQCGHTPESATDPLESIRRELARLRAENALLEHEVDCSFCCIGGVTCEKYDKLAAAVKAATSPAESPTPPEGDMSDCTCSAECPKPCKGGCGCPACQRNYGDFLSAE